MDIFTQAQAEKEKSSGNYHHSDRVTTNKMVTLEMSLSADVNKATPDIFLCAIYFGK